MNKSLAFKEEAVLITDVPRALQDWMLHKESFMERLRQRGAVGSSIRVLQQDWGLPEPDETSALAIEQNSDALIREVLIGNHDKQWMFARTILPRQTLTGEQACLMQLENRSLGSVLFNDPSMRRSEFEIACFRRQSSWNTEIGIYAKRIFPDLWARRSVFYLNEKPLLLMEVLLPDLELL